MHSHKTPRTPLSILLVDDDKTTSQVMGILLKERFPDTVILFGGNGRQGLECFKQHLPDIVITDINMPEMDGIEMAFEIKSLGYRPRFIVLTANSDEKSYEEFSEIGFDHYFMKPLNLNEVFEGIEQSMLEVARSKQKRIRKQATHRKVRPLVLPAKP